MTDTDQTSWRRVGTDPKTAFYSTVAYGDVTIDADPHASEVQIDDRTYSAEQAMELATALLTAAVLASGSTAATADIALAAETALTAARTFAKQDRTGYRIETTLGLMDRLAAKPIIGIEHAAAVSLATYGEGLADLELGVLARAVLDHRDELSAREDAALSAAIAGGAQ